MKMLIYLAYKDVPVLSIVSPSKIIQPCILLSKKFQSEFFKIDNSLPAN